MGQKNAAYQFSWIILSIGVNVYDEYEYSMTTDTNCAIHIMYEHWTNIYITR